MISWQQNDAKLVIHPPKQIVRHRSIHPPRKEERSTTRELFAVIITVCVIVAGPPNSRLTGRILLCLMSERWLRIIIATTRQHSNYPLRYSNLFQTTSVIYLVNYLHNSLRLILGPVYLANPAHLIRYPLICEKTSDEGKLQIIWFN